jgi:Mor family transcriptional regulator
VVLSGQAQSLPLDPAGGRPELAESMQPVVQAVGLAAALAIAGRFGGQNIYIRAGELAENDPLVLLVGHRAARALQERLGHGLFTVPKCQALVNAQRNAEIRARYQQGESLNLLARSFGLHRSQLFRVLASADKPFTGPGSASKPGLFDTHPTTGHSAGQEP